jgi:hypothetical protein
MLNKDPLNLLDKDNYLLSNKLHRALYLANNVKGLPVNINTSYKGIYLVCFRRLNNTNNTLVYNYLYYDKTLFLSLVVYFILRDYYIRNIGFKEWGHYLVVLDNNMLALDKVINYYILPDNKDNGINLK